jgi:hypothetical protein
MFGVRGTDRVMLPGARTYETDRVHHLPSNDLADMIIGRTLAGVGHVLKSSLW